MPVAVIEEHVASASDGMRRKRWTRAEIELVESTGLFDGQHWELVEGELIDKKRKTRKHVSASHTAVILLGRIFGQLMVEHAVNIDVSAADNAISEPEPDIIVTDRAAHLFSRNPEPRDVRLLIEVADSSLPFDRSTKAKLYARAGIIEYWVMDVRERRLFVHREPAGDAYRSVTMYNETEKISSLAAPDVQLLVGELFGPPVTEAS